MASLTVTREIEVKVNMNQLVCGQALIHVPCSKNIEDFNWLTRKKNDKVSISWATVWVDNLFTGEDEMEDYIDGSLEQQNGILNVTVHAYVKAKKYEDMVDEVVEEYRQYLEQVLPAYANIEYAKDVLLGLYPTKNVVGIECTMSSESKIVAEPTVVQE